MKAALAARLSVDAGRARLRAAGGSAGLPLTLLLLALATVFLFGNDRDGYYRLSYHSALTSDHLAVAHNMTWETGFLGFYRRWQDAEGAISYSLYNRFPVGGYLLIKLFISPFDGDFAAQIYSARILMLLAFAAAAVLAYLSLSRLTGHRWIALTATLLTFAAPYWLYFNDMVSTEIGLDFFGGMLTFHGMVLFVQEGRFRQLLVKSGLALLLGWHVYALIGVFVLAGLGSELFRARSIAPATTLWGRIRAVLFQLFRNRYLTLGVAALLFGLALLSFNFANEYRAMPGETGLTQLPSLESMQRRLFLNLNPNSGDFFPGGWPDYWRQQFHRIGRMAAPYALPGYFDSWRDLHREKFQVHYLLLGLAVTALALLVWSRARHKRLWATLVLSGFCWAILVRYNVAFHYYEAVFYTGIPLTAWSLLLWRLNRSGGCRFIAALAALALLVFGWSSFRMAQVIYPETGGQIRNLALADFEAIYDITEGYTVVYNGRSTDTSVVVNHYLRQSLGARPAAAADFLILPLRLEGLETLTPENRRIFLYPGGAVSAGYLDGILAQSGPPLLEGAWAVYRYTDRQTNPPEDWLFYVKAECRPEDRAARFLLHLTPGEVGHLSAERLAHGFDNLDFHFLGYRWQTEERCVAARRLPDYPIAAIRTGQLGSDSSPLWVRKIAMR